LTQIELRFGVDLRSARIDNANSVEWTRIDDSQQLLIDGNKRSFESSLKALESSKICHKIYLSLIETKEAFKALESFFKAPTPTDSIEVAVSTPTGAKST
jgi:hypothetical protein